MQRLSRNTHVCPGDVDTQFLVQSFLDTRDGACGLVDVIDRTPAYAVAYLFLFRGQNVEASVRFLLACNASNGRTAKLKGYDDVLLCYHGCIAA